jgi:hypothetical protein
MMGCDIHFVIEKKFDNKWIGVYAKSETPDAMPEKEYGVTPGDWVHQYRRRMVFCNRNYGFFALLAGVRGGADDAVPLGVPEDMSELASVMVEQEGSDGHSHSHLPYRDFCERFALATALAFTDEGSHSWVSGCDGDDIDSYRVVFWFDN